METWMRAAAVGLVSVALAGCESSVLVNNRPPKEPDYNAPAAGADTASAQMSADQSSDQAQAAGATVAPTTQPADQTVQTKNTRIESSSD